MKANGMNAESREIRFCNFFKDQVTRFRLLSSQFPLKAQDSGAKHIPFHLCLVYPILCI